MWNRDSRDNETRQLMTISSSTLLKATALGLFPSNVLLKIAINCLVLSLSLGYYYWKVFVQIYIQSISSIFVMCSKSTNHIKITLETPHGTLSLLSSMSVKESTFWSALILWPAMSLPCYAHDSCHIDNKFSFQISRDNETLQLMTISSSTLL